MYLFTDLFFYEHNAPLSETAITLLAIPFGLVGAWLFYRFLKRKFEKNFSIINQDDDLLDDNLVQ